MRSHRIRRILKILPFMLVFVAVFGFVVMSLWNWLMPAIFGLREIGYWQAWGLMILSRILFGGFRMGGPGGHWRHRMKERWEQMTPEEREKFRQGFYGRWSPVPPPESE
ncbi:MAG: hypothetical protein EHM61_25090 [Acidobacteria bacterium]|nr:MAG: hypothetical protein EHM61_25090 [Acidobacteriota bacterium]